MPEVIMFFGLKRSSATLSIEATETFCAGTEAIRTDNIEATVEPLEAIGSKS